MKNLQQEYFLKEYPIVEDIQTTSLRLAAAPLTYWAMRVRHVQQQLHPHCVLKERSPQWASISGEQVWS